MSNIPEWLKGFFEKNKREFAKFGKATEHKDKFWDIYEKKDVERRGDRLAYLFAKDTKKEKNICK
jgi:hypothetical protein